jgi:hypothetical protein
MSDSDRVDIIVAASSACIDSAVAYDRAGREHKHMPQADLDQLWASTTRVMLTTPADGMDTPNFAAQSALNQSLTDECTLRRRSVPSHLLEEEFPLIFGEGVPASEASDIPLADATVADLKKHSTEH